MLGQIFLGIIIFLFLMGTGSIAVSLWLEHEVNQYANIVVQKSPSLLKEVNHLYTEEIEEIIAEDPKPVSDILESFDIDDIEIDDDLLT